jgi:hypothetical protein
MSALQFQDFEYKPGRSKPEVRTLYTLHRRQYTLGPGGESTIPAKGYPVALNDVAGTGILQPRVQSIQQVKSDDGKLRIGVTFLQITQTSASATLEMEGRNYWRGRQDKVTFASAAAGEAEAFYESEFPGFGGDNAPIVKRVGIEFYPWNVDTLALIHLYYETKRKPGKARLVTVTSDREVEITREPGGGKNIIEGPDCGVGDGNHWSGYWKVVEGQNRVPQLSTEFSIQTAYYASLFDLSGAYAIARCVNADALTIVGFGTAPAGTVYLKGLRTSRVYGDDIIDLDWAFAYEPAGWNNVVKSQIGMWGVEATPTLDADGALLDEEDWRKTVVWKRGQLVVNGELITSGTAVEPQARQLFTPVNMASYLSGLTSW